MTDIKIETQRLMIRRFSPEDAGDLYDYLSQEAVVEYESYGVFSRSAAAAEAKRRAEDSAFLAVCLKDGGKVIGNLYFAQLAPERILSWELGYVFNSDYWGRGYAAEACRAIIEYAFHTLSAHRIIAMCNPKNFSSWKLLERLHFRREGHLIKNMYFKNDRDGNPIWSDTYEYALLADEYITREIL